MIIGVTGATSGIGRETVRVLRARGHTAVPLVRSPDGPDERRFDLTSQVTSDLLDGLDGLIHLSWSWDEQRTDRPDVNLEAGRALARACANTGMRPVLLSTYSARAAATSAYGRSKAALEGTFSEAGGVSLRAGLVWGGEPLAMVATLMRLARLPVVCPHLSPDPLLHHSARAVLAGALADQATGDRTDSGVLLAASPEGVMLSEIFHAAGGARRLHVPIATGPLLAGATTARRLRAPLPFRVDSLRSVLSCAAAPEAAMPRIEGFPGAVSFLAWISHAVPVGPGGNR